jgi:hypothetical protein
MFARPRSFPPLGQDRARGVEIVECTIPTGMTIAQWRRTRSAGCDHLHDTTTRYDHAAKRLDFLMVCSICGTEKLVESMPYEPRFEPNGATVHPLHPRKRDEPGRRAA